MNINYLVLFDAINQLPPIMTDNSTSPIAIFLVNVTHIYERLLTKSNFVLASLDKKECYYSG